VTGPLSDLVVEAPAAAHGTDVGRDGWLLAVELAIPNQTLWRWDVSEWDVDDWSDGYQWEDLSDRFMGAQWTRGAEGMIDRPETGTATIDLANSDGYLTAWNSSTTFPSPSYLMPGSTWRVVWHDGAGTWEPAFTGILDRNADVAAPFDVVIVSRVELVETTAALSLLDLPERPEEGHHDTTTQRFDRLLDDAAWPYGTNLGGHYSPFDTADLTGTTMAGNRLAECYLVADSVFQDGFSGRDGRWTTWAKGFFDPWFYRDGTTKVGLSEIAAFFALPDDRYYLPWPADAQPEIAVTLDDIVNDVSVSRVEGGTVGATSQDSVNTFKRRVSYRRTDLLLLDDGYLAPWAEFFLLFNATNVVKIAGLQIDANLDALAFEAITTLDIGRSVLVYRRTPRIPTSLDSAIFTCPVKGYTVSVIVRTPGILDINVDLSVVPFATTLLAPGV
jgi:hypothetical protein